MFRPKILTTLKRYDRGQFVSDLIAGLVVGIVALPLAIAFAIASGVSPEKGIITAIIAGFIISLLGGSRVQIGGPTGAFIVIVYGIVQQYGVNGLIIATLLAGVMLIVMGLVRLGSVIKFIPHPLIVGFTSGIALIIFSSQMKDLFGLQMGKTPADFIAKWTEYFKHFDTVNLYSILIASSTIILIFGMRKITGRIPGSILAVILATAAVYFFRLPVDTIGKEFGTISSVLPAPVFPEIDLDIIRKLIAPAFTIALLGGIESLLSAVVSDGMIGGDHRSNTELIAQGIANIFSSIFGGIPATGAIARTVTNVKNGGRTPVAGIVHALTLLLIMLFFGKLATLIPMSCLAGILITVAYNMSEWKSFRALLKGPKDDVLVLLSAFFLTVLVDLTVAIEIGMVLAAFMFMRRMIQISNVNIISKRGETGDDPKAIEKFDVPAEVEVFEITGPFFFGAAYKFKESLRRMKQSPRVLIIRMRHVPVVDATGLHALEEVFHYAEETGMVLVLSGVQPQVMELLHKTGLYDSFGAENIHTVIDDALDRAKIILNK